MYHANVVLLFLGLQWLNLYMVLSYRYMFKMKKKKNEFTRSYLNIYSDYCN